MAIVFSPSMVMLEGDPDAPDLSHARIGYAKHSGSISASSAADGFPASAANNALTYSFWKPVSSSSNWVIDYGEVKSVDYVGIAAHEIGSVGATVYVDVWNGTAWVNIISHTPANDSPIMFIFDELTVSSVRVRLTGGAPRVGVIYTGIALVMERAIYGGHSPITLSRVTSYSNNVSESGQWLGRSVKSKGSATTFAWSNLTAAWYRQYFDSFVSSAKTQPFFIAWRPDQYPDEVGYCWTNKDIVPSNSGQRDLMSVSLAVEGLAIE